jgi:DNA-binding transcriptional ArsR family regulator
MLFNQTVEDILLHQEVEYKMGSAAQPLLDQVYGAIADPTRRAILTVLAGGEANVGGLAGRFPISLNAVSKHVKVLERAGLVRRRILGREHVLRLNPGPLREATRWLEHYRAFWDTRLDALEAFLVGEEPPAAAGRGRRTGRRRA